MERLAEEVSAGLYGSTLSIKKQRGQIRVHARRAQEVRVAVERARSGRLAALASRCGGLNRVPDLANLGSEAGKSTGVFDDPRGEALLLAQGHLGREPRLGLTLRQTVSLPKARNLQLARRGDQDHAVHLVLQAIFDQKRCVVDRHRHPALGKRGLLVEERLVNPRMNDGVECGTL